MNIFKKSKIVYVSSENLFEEIEKFDKITSASVSYSIDKFPSEAFRKVEDFTEEKFDAWVKNRMISSNAETFKMELSLTYKDVATGYKLKAVAKRNMKTDEISYKFTGVYGYFVPMFGKLKSSYYLLFYYLFDKKSRKLVQLFLKELLWKSVLV